MTLIDGLIVLGLVLLALPFIASIGPKRENDEHDSERGQ